MALIVTLNNCGHINIASAASIPLIAVTLAELQDPFTPDDAPVLQRLKCLVQEFVRTGSARTRENVRAFLLERDA